MLHEDAKKDDGKLKPAQSIKVKQPMRGTSREINQINPYLSRLDIYCAKSIVG